MNTETPTPRSELATSQFIAGQSIELNQVKNELAETRAELAICRVTLGIGDKEKIVLDQTPQHGSILIDCGSSRRRCSPTNAENIALCDELTAAQAALAESEAKREQMRKALEEVRLYLINDLVEPGRTVFWKIVDALKGSTTTPPTTVLNSITDMVEKHGQIVFGIILDGDDSIKECIPSLSKVERTVKKIG